MKKYVYFICAALHCKNEIVLFRNFEYSFPKKISSGKEIIKISEDIKKREYFDNLVYVSIINYQLLREEE